jgi:peroxiredoxin
VFKLILTVSALGLLHFNAAAQVTSLPESVLKELCALFERDGPGVGQPALDFTLDNVEGGKIHAADLWAKKPVVVICGSYSCPFFRMNAAALNALVRDLSIKVTFLTVYNTEAHPSDARSPYSGIPMTPDENRKEGISVPLAKTQPERLAAARRCRESLGLTSLLAVDGMDNAVWKAYGGSMNFAYLIGTDGKVLVKQGIFNPAALRTALGKLPAS